MRTHSKTPLFLMELMIMLLVFSIAAAVCLQVFAGAKRISIESQRKDAAITQVQTAAEYWKSTGGNIEKTASKMGVQSDGNHFIVYDETQDTHMDFYADGPKAEITVWNETEEIFSVNCEAVMIDG